MDMTKENFWRAGLLALAVFISPTLPAAADSGYQVEIIVFERNAKDAAAIHDESNNKPPPDYSNAVIPGTDNIGLLAPNRSSSAPAARRWCTPAGHSGAASVAPCALPQPRRKPATPRRAWMAQCA